MDEDDLIKTGMEVALKPVTDIAEDALGVLGGDWLKEVRRRNRERLQENTKKKLKDRGAAKVKEPSPSEIIPLLRVAQDESQAELADLWASLTATLMDPQKKHLFRREFIEIAKKLEAIDVGVLPLLQKGDMRPSKREVIAHQLGVGPDEVQNSFRNLAKLELSAPEILTVASAEPNLTPLGRHFMMAVAG